MSPTPPTYRGISAVVIAILLGVFLPALLPARDGHTGRLTRELTTIDWAIAIVSVVVSVAACAFAVRRRQTADTICAIAAALMTTWMLYVFLEHCRVL
jgi:hypothetical protein